jgi:hypothetical protein
VCDETAESGAARPPEAENPKPVGDLADVAASLAAQDVPRMASKAHRSVLATSLNRRTIMIAERIANTVYAGPGQNWANE